MEKIHAKLWKWKEMVLIAAKKQLWKLVEHIGKVHSAITVS